MVKEDQAAATTSLPPAVPRRCCPNRGPAFRLAALALAAVSLSATGFLMLRLLNPPEGGGQAPAQAPVLFQFWPRDRQPDLVLLLSGETYGYLQPCGCSSPQYGGLERRYNFMKTLVGDRRWKVVGLDLGDLAQKNGPQALMKYRYTMQAYQRLKYAAVGIGRNEMALPLIDALSEYSLNNPSPRVLAANLLKKEENFPSGEGGKSMVGSWTVAAPQGGPRVGIAGVVAASVSKQVQDPHVAFAPAEAALGGVVKELAAQKPDVLVLLFQGNEKEAQACAARFPQFDLILCLTDDDEPPEKADRAGRTMIVRAGHKGRAVGTVGLFRTAKADAPWELHYQMVRLGPEYETPAGQDAANPILALLDEYTREVKEGNYLAQYARTDHPIQRAFPGAAYVGSEKCKRCHEREYAIWKASPHAHAYETLEKAKRPSLRQYDGECVVCHVTGFEYKGGYADEKATPHLRENGCENCHGPGSHHVKGNTDPKLLALMNPYKTAPNETAEAKKQRMNRLDDSCFKCHNTDNDVHWNIKKWVEGKIAH